jgi:hypothetical protein
LHGVQTFEYLSSHPEKAKMFDAAMVANSSLVTDAVVHAYDFSSIKSIVDVGGGRGTMVCAILDANTQMRGIVFDLPHVAAGAQEFIARHGLTSRCEFIGGDFFASIPTGADIYFLQRVLHDWGDEDCVRLLRRCATAMGDKSRMLLSEAVIPPGNDPFYGKLTDLHMLVTTHGGRERTRAGWAKLLDTAGLCLQRLVPTNSPLSLIEAHKV